ncbi:MAG: response regulator transcription factor, partial [Anaerolineae bacterium]|nr:response regulator transcription factor [Anaerolineae bacterium]
EALALVQTQPVDLILIDLVMPGIGGIELMRRLQEVAPDTVVIVLTARGSMETAIEALRLGAHDYLTKPCDDRLLKRCIETGLAKRREEMRHRKLVDTLGAAALELAGEPALFSSTPPASAEKPICVGELAVNVADHTATLAGHVLNLTPTEFDLLIVLAHNVGHTFSHSELVQAIRGYEAEDWEAKEIVRYHVHGLRTKLGDADYVKTVRGVGYRLVMPE